LCPFFYKEIGADFKIIVVLALLNSLAVVIPLDSPCGLDHDLVKQIRRNL
jgi:hypothetical protein